jgi:hypothetical protein
MTPTNAGVPSAGAPRRDRKAAQAVPGDLHAIMREQLDFLIEHAESGCAGCGFCERYARVKGVLLEIFAD